MPRAFAEIAFTPAVRAMQAKQGSADSYAKFLRPDVDRADRLGEKEDSFIRARDGFYQATISEAGWPYVQFRGGPVGFLNPLDEKTIAYADFRGNRQYLSVGNMTENDKIALILMDYPNRRRLKIWGRTQIIDGGDDPALIARLHDNAYRAQPERAVIITVEAFDWNCPQHIPQRLTMEELQLHLAPLHAELASLKEELAHMRAQNASEK